MKCDPTWLVAVATAVVKLGQWGFLAGMKSAWTQATEIFVRLAGHCVLVYVGFGDEVFSVSVFILFLRVAKWPAGQISVQSKV